MENIHLRHNYRDGNILTHLGVQNGKSVDEDGKCKIYSENLNICRQKCCNVWYQFQWINCQKNALEMKQIIMIIVCNSHCI